MSETEKQKGMTREHTNNTFLFRFAEFFTSRYDDSSVCAIRLHGLNEVFLGVTPVDPAWEKILLVVMHTIVHHIGFIMGTIVQITPFKASLGKFVLTLNLLLKRGGLANHRVVTSQNQMDSSTGPI